MGLLRSGVLNKQLKWTKKDRALHDPISTQVDRNKRFVRRRPFRLYGDSWRMVEWWPLIGKRLDKKRYPYNYPVPIETIYNWAVIGAPEYTTIRFDNPHSFRDLRYYKRWWDIPYCYRRMFVRGQNIQEFGERLTQLVLMLKYRTEVIQDQFGLTRPQLWLKYQEEIRAIYDLADKVIVKLDEINRVEQCMENMLDVLDTEIPGIKLEVLSYIKSNTEQSLHITPPGVSYNPAPIEKSLELTNAYVIPSGIQGVPDPRVANQLVGDSDIKPKPYGEAVVVENLGLGAEVLRLKSLHISNINIGEQLRLSSNSINTWLAYYRSLPDKFKLMYHQRDVFNIINNLQDSYDNVYNYLEQLLNDPNIKFDEKSTLTNKGADINEILLTFFKELRSILKQALDITERVARKDKLDKFLTRTIDYMEGVPLDRKVAALKALKETPDLLGLLKQGL